MSPSALCYIATKDQTNVTVAVLFVLTKMLKVRENNQLVNNS